MEIVLKSFQKVFNKLNEIYSSSDEDTVEIEEDDKNEVYRSLSNFSGECRKDLEISET